MSLASDAASLRPSMSAAVVGNPGTYVDTVGIDRDAGSGGSTSGTSWGAIFAGATAASALSLILIVLGTGLGFATTSPWTDQGVDGSTFGMGAIAWIIITQIIAAAVGGYLAGRLRVRWAGLHTDEVYFRDTAHGFLSWGVATLIVALAISSVAGSLASGGAKMIGAAATAGTAAAAGAGGSAMARGASAGAGGQSNAGSQGGSGDSSSTGSMAMPYSVDTLFRSDANAPGAQNDGAAPRAEATRIMARGVRDGQLSDADTEYLSQLVARRTGLSPTDAKNRVTTTFSDLNKTITEARDKAKAAADEARRAAAKASLWIFVALLAGAFCASVAGTLGGRRRDNFA